MVQQLIGFDGIYGKVHWLFLLDCSESMAGRRWTDLRSGFENMMKKRKQAMAGDKLSVRLFAGLASGTSGAYNLDDSSIYQYITGDFMKEVPFSKPTVSNGTSFNAALMAARQLVGCVQKGYRPVVVMMTDGECNGPDADAAVAQAGKLHSEFKQGLLFFGIGIGSQLEQLKRIVLAGNGGVEVSELAGGEPVPMLLTGPDTREITAFMERLVASYDLISIDYEKKRKLIRQATAELQNQYVSKKDAQERDYA